MPICNATLSYPADLADVLLQSQLLKFDEVRDRDSQTIKQYRSSHKYRDLRFTINPGTGQVIMKGSWAKFHNQGLHNHTPYLVADFRNDINALSETFNYDFSQGRIHGVEAGVNLRLTSLLQPCLTPDYLISRLVCYKGRLPFVPMKTIRGVGAGVECCLTNYRIKVYDKGTQYHRPEPILRIEYDCNQIKELTPLGIQVLSDLTHPRKLMLLGEKIQGLVADCVLMEPMDEKSLLPVDKKLYGQAERPMFWQGLSRRQRVYYLNRFRSLIDAYSPQQLHSTLCKLVWEEWQGLVQDCNVFLGLANGTRKADEGQNCNIFLSVNSGKRYKVPDTTTGVEGWPCLPSTEPADESNSSTPSVATFSQERRCEVTGLPLDKEQPWSSEVVGITTLRRQRDIARQLGQRYGQRTRKRDYHPAEYYLAHGLRNEKSNAPNNLRRRLIKAIHNTPLFSAGAVVRLTAEQQALLTYFDGTPYQVKLYPTVS